MLAKKCGGHFDILKKCELSLVKVEEGLDLKIPGDLLAMDIRETLHHLGEITGRSQQTIY